MTRTECYLTLGLQLGASARDVHRAYKRLALRFHPDRNGGNAESNERFCRVTEAYAALQAMTRVTSQDPAITCSSCGRFEPLFQGLDKRLTCAACLLNRRRRLLPGPPIYVIRCLAAVAMLITATILIGMAVFEGDRLSAGAAILLAVGSLIALSVNVLSADVIE